MSDWTELTWADAMQRGYEAICAAREVYEDIDTVQGRSNQDIEKHLRRAEVKIAEGQAWFTMARELGSRQDRFSGPGD
jgi:predicted transcriptional regulator